MASSDLIPFAGSRALFGPEPLLSLHREMNRLFDDFFRGGPGASAGGLAALPRLDVHENEQELCIVADVPGVSQADLDLRLDGDILTLSGERKSDSEQKQQDYHVMERSYGRFQRSVQLPFTPGADQVRASFDNGVLTVRLPKQGAAQRSRRIEVRSGGEAPAAAGQAGTAGTRAPAGGSDAGAASRSAAAGSESGEPAAGDGLPPPGVGGQVGPQIDARTGAAAATGA